MKRTGRIVLLTAAVAAVYIVFSGIGWAAVFYWKSEPVVIMTGLASTIICPMEAIEVVPQGPLDTPLFFVPMMLLCFMLWAFVIDALWNLKRKRADAARA